MDDKLQIQAAEVLKRQARLIKQLRIENSALKGELATGAEGPLSELRSIILDESAYLRVRIEAAALVLQYRGPDPVTKIAVAFLTATTSRDDVPASDRVDAIRALAKRAMPKASAPNAPSVDFAERLREARRREARQKANSARSS